jgi:GNAT superfamily N-acetyltransferase
MADDHRDISLEDFEQRIHVRQVTLDDFEALRDLDIACYPDHDPVPRDQLASQVTIFPEGQLCIEYEGQLVAAASSLIVDFDNYDEWHNWREISDDGFIRNHDPDGDTLYGIEIMVHPEFRGLKLARRIYEARKNLARERNLPHIIICGRIPGYAKYANKMSAYEYVNQVMQRNVFDPVLTVQLSNGFVLQRLVPNYLPEDSDSRGYATFLKWNNLEYQEKTTRRFRAVSLVRICVVQYGMRTVSSFEQFAEQVDFFTDVASDYQSDFIVFPELLTTQLLPLVQARHPSEAARRLAEYTPQYLELFTELAIKYNVNIVGGSQFAVEDDRLYNIAYLFRRNGTIGKQYKIHITPSERQWWGVSRQQGRRLRNRPRPRLDPDLL